MPARAEQRADSPDSNTTVSTENKLEGLTYQFMDFLDKEEYRWSELSSFVQAERDWGDRTVSKFIDREIEREKAYQGLVADFVRDSFAREEAAKQAASDILQTADARARTDERVVREVASDFLDAELSRAFSEISVCTDGLACGPNGGLDLFEALCAFKFALGLDVLVVAGHCQGVCPRDDRTVAVRCPDSALQTCVGSDLSTAAAMAGRPLSSTGPKDQQQRSVSTNLDALLSQLGTLKGDGGKVPALANGKEASGRDTGGTIEEDKGARLAPAARERRGRGDFSLRRDRKGLSWSVVAARLVLAELRVEVPVELVCAHRASFFAQTWLAGGDAEAALPLFSFALEHAPPWLLVPIVETEEEEAARQALVDWGDSIWFETHHESLLKFPPAGFYDTFLEEGVYGVGSDGGSLSHFVARRGTGFLTGRWREMSKGDETPRTGTFQLKMSSGGHAFLGERFDPQGRSLGLWHGHRLLVDGPPARPPPIGLVWVVASYVGRARARFALYLSDMSERKEAFSFPRERNGALEAIVADCRDAVSLWRWCPEAWAVLAACHEERGDLVGAIEAYEELLFLQPLGPVNMLKVNDVEALRDRSEDGLVAAAAAEDALKRDPKVALRVAHRSARLRDLWVIAAARDAERSDGSTCDGNWQGVWAKQVNQNRVRSPSMW